MYSMRAMQGDANNKSNVKKYNVLTNIQRALVCEAAIGFRAV